MSNPDPEKFAKVVLWHLAGVRAEIAAIETRLAVLEARIAGGVPSEAAQQEWEQRTQDQQARLYLDACKEAGLPPEKPPIFPPRDDGGIE
jgi:hypothetical protein